MKIPAPIALVISIFALLAGNAFLPNVSHAETLLSGEKVSVSSSTPDNTYIVGGQVNVNVPLPADLAAAGGTLTVASPVSGDALLAGGTVDVQKPVLGDARIIGGRVTVTDTIGGDLVAGGGFVTVSGRAKNTLLGGGTVSMLNGSDGRVTIYGVNVSLAGVYAGDVQVVASDHLSLAEGTVIKGVLKYNAPQQADIPPSALIQQGVTYIGSTPYLPTVQQAKTFATAGLWVFFLVQVTAALVATGLIAGLFPGLTDQVVEMTLTRTPERLILLTLLGFASFIVVPVLLILLLVSFVGIGLAFIIGCGYLLFLLLSYVYAAVLAGSAFLYVIRRQRRISSWHVSWRGALVGVIILHLIGLIPYIGLFLKVVLSAMAGGALLTLFYRFAFRRSVASVDID